MANSAVLTTASQSADLGVTTFIARNNAGVYASLYATQISLTAGESPGYGFFAIPINEFGDETAPAVAFKTSGIAGKLKPGSRIAFDFLNGTASTTVLTGTLVQYVHVVHEDSVLGLVFDDKWLLSKVTVFGRATYDPRNQRYFFDAGAKCVFNELGFPNCIDTPYGPRFAPFHRFGWRLNDFEEPEAGAALQRARTWTVADIMEYLREMHYSSGSQPPGMKQYGNLRVPHWVNWPKSLGHVFGDVRACMDFDLDNKSVLQAVCMTLRRAGAYDLLCKPGKTEFDSELYVANMNPPTNNTGFGLMLPSYDTSLNLAGLINTSNVIHSGYINESIINFSNDVTVLGDPAVVERLVTTAFSGASADGMPTESLYGLEPAWDRGGALIGTKAVAQSDEWKVFDYVATNHATVGSYKLAWQQALSKWPTVFAEYRVPISSDLFIGTKWSGQSNKTNPRIRPTLLTGDNHEDANPGNWKPKPIVIETCLDGTSAWEVAARQNELTITPDGRSFRIESLRDAIYTWTNTGSGDSYKPYEDSDTDHVTPLIQPQHIRLTLAIESEFRITGRAKSDPNTTRARVTDAPYTYCNVSSPLNYVEWLRQKSYPVGGTTDMHGDIPIALGGPLVFPDKCLEGSELFTDRTNETDGRLPKNAVAKLKFHKRIEYTGQLILANLNPAMHPGLPIQIDGGGTIPVFSVIKTVTFDAALQTTAIDLAAADSEHIYNIPAPGPMKSATQTDIAKDSDSGGDGKYGNSGNGGSNGSSGGAGAMIESDGFDRNDISPGENEDQARARQGHARAMENSGEASNKRGPETTKRQQMEGDEGAAGKGGAEGAAGSNKKTLADAKSEYAKSLGLESQGRARTLGEAKSEYGDSLGLEKRGKAQTLSEAKAAYGKSVTPDSGGARITANGPSSKTMTPEDYSGKDFSKQSEGRDYTKLSPEKEQKDFSKQSGYSGRDHSTLSNYEGKDFSRLRDQRPQ